MTNGKETHLEPKQKKSKVFGLRPVAGVMPGVHSVHEQAKSAGLKIVVVTGSGQRSLLHKLTVDFAGFVSSELIVSSFDVKHGKPDPEPYLVGLAKAGVEPPRGRRIHPGRCSNR